MDTAHPNFNVSMSAHSSPCGSMGSDPANSELIDRWQYLDDEAPPAVLQMRPVTVPTHVDSSPGQTVSVGGPPQATGAATAPLAWTPSPATTATPTLPPPVSHTSPSKSAASSGAAPPPFTPYAATSTRGKPASPVKSPRVAKAPVPEAALPAPAAAPAAAAAATPPALEASSLAVLLAEAAHKAATERNWAAYEDLQVAKKNLQQAKKVLQAESKAWRYKEANRFGSKLLEAVTTCDVVGCTLLVLLMAVGAMTTWAAAVSLYLTATQAFCAP